VHRLFRGHEEIATMRWRGRNGCEYLVQDGGYTVALLMSRDDKQAKKEAVAAVLEYLRQGGKPERFR